MEKKNFDFPTGRVVAIVISFLLAVLDMIFLYSALQKALGMERAQSMLTAFLIATIANYSAFEWGHQNGKNQNKKINFSGILWVIIGLFYAFVRGVALYRMFQDNAEVNIIGEIGQIVILAVFYIGTGVTIRSSAAEIFDADAVRYRKAKKDFEILHQAISDDNASIMQTISYLKKFSNHYRSLERQRDKIEMGILKSEKATAATIESLVLKNAPKNAGISASAVHHVAEEALNKARDERSK